MKFRLTLTPPWSAFRTLTFLPICTPSKSQIQPCHTLQKVREHPVRALTTMPLLLPNCNWEVSNKYIIIPFDLEVNPTDNFLGGYHKKLMINTFFRSFLTLYKSISSTAVNSLVWRKTTTAIFRIPVWYNWIYVVVQFSPWFKFYFPLFWGMVMYDNEF